MSENAMFNLAATTVTSPCKPARLMAVHHVLFTSSSRTAKLAQSNASDQANLPFSACSLVLSMRFRMQRFIWENTWVSRGCNNQIIPDGT